MLYKSTIDIDIEIDIDNGVGAQLAPPRNGFLAPEAVMGLVLPICGLEQSPAANGYGAF